MAESVISAIGDHELVETGRYLVMGPLLAQAGYTLGLVAADREGLEAILGSEVLDGAAARAEVLNATVQNRATARDESKELTGAQALALRLAILWRRKAQRLGTILRRRGVAEASNLQRITSPDKKLASVATEIEEKIGLIERYADRAPSPQWARQLAEEGRTRLADLRQSDAAQEVKIASLPADTRASYRDKALLYLAIKQINDAGQILHMEDPIAAGRYNLEIYHRSR